MLTQERVKELLSYDPDDGHLKWRVSKGGVKAGSKAGTTTNRGYVHIRVDGVIYVAHRIVWLWSTGLLPDKEIDHINGVKDDNRIENLRLATRSQNAANTRRYKNNKSGVKGVFWDNTCQKWQARIMHQGKQKYLGLFDEIEAAKEAYSIACEHAFGEFMRLS